MSASLHRFRQKSWPNRDQDHGFALMGHVQTGSLDRFRQRSLRSKLAHCLLGFSCFHIINDGCIMRSGLKWIVENLGFGLGQNADLDTLLSDGDFVHPFHHICALFWA